MTAVTKPASGETIRLEYSLHDLPTAQHKAGLAGLLFHIRNLTARNVNDAPVIQEIAPDHAFVRLTESSTQVLFDDLFDARWEEVGRKLKIQNKRPKRVEESVKDAKKEKVFIYDEFLPCGAPLAHYLNSGNTSPWRKLWKDMLWAVLRAQPKTRDEYKARADGNPSTTGKRIWGSLQKAQSNRTRGRQTVESIAGSVYIGAQDRNAERVGFQGVVEQNLLLYFWPWVAPVFVPQIIDVKNRKRNYKGFLLAVPEVADLKEFLALITEFWQTRDPAVAGYRPRQALIDFPEEGGLEFLHALASHRMAHQEISDVLLAVEFYHQEKQGKNVRMLASGRLLPDRRVLDEFGRIRDSLGSPLFKTLRIRNLLKGNPWYGNAQELFSTCPAEFFIQTAKTPRFGFFGADAGQHFRYDVIQTLKHLEQEGSAMQDSETVDRQLARRVYYLVRDYVRVRAAEKVSGGTAEREAREKVAMNAFLAMRGRREEAFVEYFTGTICAVPHYLPEEDFLSISRALMEDPGSVKDLAMIALSAHSWSPRKQESPENETEGVEQ